MNLDWTQKKVLDFFREHVTRGTLIFRVDDRHEVVLGDGQEPKAAMTIPDWGNTLKMALTPDPGFGEAFMRSGFDLVS
ncbi:MAG TPA: class I SAM-dependent methyltransferase, partial [Thalassospira lucentensis]|nr:class I SAM-dependent methyltransferase [Thalassospira lucentensis]